MDILKILPLAFVMIAGPQIITAFLFVTSENWRQISAAYVLGAGLSISLVLGAAYLLTKGAGEGGEGSGPGLTPVDYVMRNFLKRNESEPPKWMGRLQSATAKPAFALGFLLLGFFPSDLVTSISIGGFLSSHGDPYWHGLVFVLLTMLLLAVPALLVVTMGSRAHAFLPKVRSWMDQNSWIISEIVIVFFIVIILTG
jgi:hypothetical protein